MKLMKDLADATVQQSLMTHSADLMVSPTETCVLSNVTKDKSNTLVNATNAIVKETALNWCVVLTEELIPVNVMQDVSGRKLLIELLVIPDN